MVATTTSKVYACAAANAEEQMSWSEDHKSWCCQTIGLGCPDSDQTALAPTLPVSTTPEYYDCEFGYDNWQVQWSDAEKKWCCAYSGRGCEWGVETTTPVPHDCQTVADNVARGWPAPQSVKEWCCANGGILCSAAESAAVAATTVTTTYVTYDCQAEYTSWASGWPIPPDMQRWCCQTAGVLCNTTTTMPPYLYDCHDQLANWGAEKRAWCCKTDGLGCESSQPYMEKFEQRPAWRLQPRSTGPLSVERLATGAVTGCCCLLGLFAVLMLVIRLRQSASWSAGVAEGPSAGSDLSGALVTADLNPMQLQVLPQLGGDYHHRAAGRPLQHYQPLASQSSTPPASGPVALLVE